MLVLQSEKVPNKPERQSEDSEDEARGKSIDEMTFWRLLQFAGHSQSARGGGQSSAIFASQYFSTQASYLGWIILHLFENESNHPEESKDDVFCHGEVVVSGAKQFILILTMNKI